MPLHHWPKAIIESVNFILCTLVDNQENSSVPSNWWNKKTPCVFLLLSLLTQNSFADLDSAGTKSSLALLDLEELSWRYKLCCLQGGREVKYYLWRELANYCNFKRLFWGERYCKSEKSACGNTDGLWQDLAGESSRF